MLLSLSRVLLKISGKIQKSLITPIRNRLHRREAYSTAMGDLCNVSLQVPHPRTMKMILWSGLGLRLGGQFGLKGKGYGQRFKAK
jgi:hypothetical protein